MSATFTAKPEALAYNRERRTTLATAMWATILVNLKDEDGVVVVRTEEVMEAMALIGGIVLGSHPDARTPGGRRKLAEGWAKQLTQRTKEAHESGSIADFVIDGSEVRQ